MRCPPRTSRFTAAIPVWLLTTGGCVDVEESIHRICGKRLRLLAPRLGDQAFGRVIGADDHESTVADSRLEEVAQCLVNRGGGISLIRGWRVPRFLSGPGIDSGMMGHPGQLTVEIRHQGGPHAPP